jgi:hypothetical protein
VSFLNRLVDERFLRHRLRSTSVAGVAGGFVAISLFAYRFYIEQVWSWDLFAVGITIAVVKIALLTWYLVTD